jgi:hypothetical protein
VTSVLTSKLTLYLLLVFLTFVPPIVSTQTEIYPWMDLNVRALASDVEIVRRGTHFVVNFGTIFLFALAILFANVIYRLEWTSSNYYVFAVFAVVYSVIGVGGTASIFAEAARLSEAWHQLLWGYAFAPIVLWLVYAYRTPDDLISENQREKRETVDAVHIGVVAVITLGFVALIVFQIVSDALF